MAFDFTPSDAVEFLSFTKIDYVNSLTSASSTAIVHLSGSGAAPRASLPDLDFGDLPAGTKKELPSIFMNTGIVPITMANVTIAPTVGSGFSIAASTCSGTIAPGGTCTITVRFTAPANISSNTGALTLISSAGQQFKSTVRASSVSGVISYQLGVGGLGGNGSNNGANGTATSVSYNGTTLFAGGGGGYYNSTVAAVGGTGSGGATAVTGGLGGLGRTGISYGGGGGGAIGGGNGSSGNGAQGGDGGVVYGVQGLPTVLANAGFDTYSRAVGASNSTADYSPGGNTYAIGYGGGGAAPSGGGGGQGGPGGGGGGAPAVDTMSGNGGGSGAVVYAAF